MTGIIDILTASYSISREADTIGKELKKLIGAESNYEIIRLALGCSLGLDSLPEPAPDAKGGVMKGCSSSATKPPATTCGLACSERCCAGGAKKR